MNPVFGILAEDVSDKETLTALLKTLTGQPRLTILGRNFKGKSNLLKEGGRELRSLHQDGCQRFLICIDCDQDDPSRLRRRVESEIVALAPSSSPCIVIPVRAIEA